MAVYRVGNNSYAVHLFHAGHRSQASGGAANTAGTGYSTQDRFVGPTARAHAAREMASRFFTFTEDAVTEVALAGSSAGVASTSGALTVTQSLAGASAGVSTAAGSLTVTVSLAGSSAGAAESSGTLTVTEPAPEPTGGGGGWRPIERPARRMVYLKGASAGVAECQGNLTVGAAVALRGRSRGAARCRGRMQAAVIQNPTEEELLLILLTADVI